MSVVGVTKVLRSWDCVVWSLCYKIGSADVTRCEIVLQNIIVVTRLFVFGDAFRPDVSHSEMRARTGEEQWKSEGGRTADHKFVIEIKKCE